MHYFEANVVKYTPTEYSVCVYTTARAAILSRAAAEAPRAQPANRFLVRVLLYLMIHECGGQE